MSAFDERDQNPRADFSSTGLKDIECAHGAIACCQLLQHFLESPTTALNNLREVLASLEQQ